MRKKPFLCAVLLALSATRVAASEKPWQEVRSPHFRVLTDADLSDARRVASDFELLRAFFASEYPKFRLDSGAPLLIFAVRDESSAKALIRALGKGASVSNTAGYFHLGWEKKYALVRLDLYDQARIIAFHEYTHSILHLNSQWLPTWLNEGLAEFYGSTQFRDNKVFVGAPTEGAGILQWASLFPVEALITTASPIDKDATKTAIFYAESWALVHYLIFGSNMNGGEKLIEFLNKVVSGEDQKKAFEEQFGAFHDLDRNLQAYARRFSFQARIVNAPPVTDPKDYATRKLTTAESEAESAGYDLWSHDAGDAHKHVQAALQEEPKLGLAHEELGFLDFAEGKDADSANEFEQATSLDSSLYLSVFAKAMLSGNALSDDATRQEQLRKDMDAVLAINPQFAPAYVQLAKLAVRQQHLNVALACSRKAEELEPFRAGYHLLTAQILLLAGKGPDAAGFAKFVADRWYGSDHNEALEIWDRVPAEQRPPSEAIRESAPKDTQEVEGTIESIACGQDGTWALTLDHSGQPLVFHRAPNFSFGFSDTLWFGEDHINACYHLDGLRTIIHYIGAANPTYAGDAVELELRDDLLEPSASHAPSPSAPSAAQSSK